jgi:hypothetical protein
MSAKACRGGALLELLDRGERTAPYTARRMLAGYAIFCRRDAETTSSRCADVRFIKNAILRFVVGLLMCAFCLMGFGAVAAAGA